LTGYTGESAQGKNELGLYTDRISQPIGPGLRVGEEQGYYGPDSKYDNQAVKPPASEYEGMWDNRGINQTRSALDFIDPNLATSTAEIYGTPWSKRIGEQQGINLEEAAFSEEQKKSLVPNRASPEYSMMKAAFKKAQNMNSQQFDKWIGTTVLEGEYYDKLSDALKFNETPAGKIDMIGKDATEMIDLPGLGDDKTEVDKAAASLLRIVSGVKNKYAHDNKAREKLRFSNKYYEDKDLFKSLGIDNIKDLDKFFDAVYDQAKLSKPKDQMTVAHGGRITKALGSRSRDI